jgi:hypothetical protein
MQRLFSLTTLIAFIVASTTESCRSTKNIPKAIAKTDTTIVNNTETNADSLVEQLAFIEKLKTNVVDYNTFSAKIKVDYNDGESKVPDVNAFVRIRKDSIIWINIEAFLINTHRIKIKPDSFFLHDKIKDTYLARPLSYLQELTNIPFDFKTLENLLVGNPVYMHGTFSAYKKNEVTSTIVCITEVFKNLITVNNENATVTHSKLDDLDAMRSRTCDITFSDFEKAKDNKLISTKRYIVISEKSKIEIDLHYKKYEFDAAQTYPFTVPKKVKVL